MAMLVNNLNQVTSDGTSYTYDNDYNWNGSSWAFIEGTRYVYDGMLVVQERDYNSVPTVTYIRGTDLSGSQQGAGGIGGLLARVSGYASGTWSTINSYHAAGNGNITYLVNSSQTAAATYKYNPFGGTISASGSCASANVYRFSSKEIHANSGLYYHGYRFYDCTLGKLLNRDPAAGGNSGAYVIGPSGDGRMLPQTTALAQFARDPFSAFEKININLYQAMSNDPNNNVDPYGLCGWQFTGPWGSNLPPTAPPAPPEARWTKQEWQNLADEYNYNTPISLTMALMGSYSASTFPPPPMYTAPGALRLFGWQATMATATAATGFAAGSAFGWLYAETGKLFAPE